MIEFNYIIIEDNLCFWFLFRLEAIGSNTCSLLNCKDYWKRPDNDVSGALFLKGPSRPHLCFCLHMIVLLFYFIQSMLKRRESL